MKVCLNCKEILLINKYGPKKKFCSVACSHKHKYDYQPKRKWVEIICKYCGERFMKNLFNQKFCKQECCRNYWNDIWKNSPEKANAFYKIRFEVFKRDEFKCTYCGRSPIEEDVILELEHIDPVNGVKPNWEETNMKDLTTSCRECNVGKSNNVLTIDIIKRIKTRLKTALVKPSSRPKHDWGCLKHENTIKSTKN